MYLDTSALFVASVIAIVVIVCLVMLAALAIFIDEDF
jgi:hypothetical protein